MVYNGFIEALAKLGGIKEWICIHVKVGLPGDKKHELYFSNPDYVPPVVKSEEVKPQPEAVVRVQPEALVDKIKRMRFAKEGELSQEEELWFKERQKELEYQKIGQIQPDDSMETAMEKLKKIGLEK